MSKVRVGTLGQPRSAEAPLRRWTYPGGPFATIGILLCMLTVCTGCTGLRQWYRNGFKVGPNYCPPPAPTSPAWIDSADRRVQAAEPFDAWWTLFGDPILDDLIATAARQNLDLQTAGTRILEARSVRNVAVGNLFPQSQGALGTYVRGQVPFNEIPPFNQAPGVSNEFNLFGTGFGALWEADFWGRYRRNIIARQSLLNASVENYRDALVMLVSDVARSYIQYRTFQQRLDYARRNVAIQKGTLDLAETRFRAGTATNLDVQQAESSLELTESTIPQLEIGLRQSANSVCVLLGMPVGDLSGMLEVHPIPHAPPEVAVGIPADLLRRRPDVRRAEREVAAQSEQIGIAQANLYPHIGIGGFMGYASTDLKDLFQSRSFTGFIFPTLQWNILNYGRILNDVRAKDATFRGKVLSYQQTVLRAGREVEDALVAFLKTQRQAWRLQKSTQAAQKAVDLVTEQYEGGIADFNRVYNTQTTLVTQQDLLAQARGNIALYLVAVYQALGGGWQSFGGPGQPPAPPSLAHHHGPHP